MPIHPKAVYESGRKVAATIRRWSDDAPCNPAKGVLAPTDAAPSFALAEAEKGSGFYSATIPADGLADEAYTVCLRDVTTGRVFDWYAVQLVGGDDSPMPPAEPKPLPKPEPVPPPVILNGGFEDPPMAALVTAIPPANWATSGARPGAGFYRSQAGSPFTSGNPAPPEGKVVAVFWNTCEASQVVHFGADGRFTVALSLAARANHGAANDVEVRLDGVPVGRFTPGSMNFAEYRTAPFDAKAGDRKVSVAGLASNGLDSTALVDDVRIEAAP